MTALCMRSIYFNLKTLLVVYFNHIDIDINCYVVICSLDSSMILNRSSFFEIFNKFRTINSNNLHVTIFLKFRRLKSLLSFPQFSHSLDVKPGSFVC